MSEPASIAGSIEPGRQALADFPFYAGPVGVRERDGWIDVAFFAPEVRVKLPLAATLDGRGVRVTAISTRQIDPIAKSRGAMCAITATVISDPAA